MLLAATPLGNPRDASARLVQALESADVIAAEDTRRLRRLARDLDVSLRARVVSLHDAVEERRSADLAEEALAGREVLVVTDAGMPAVSDPGYRVVRAALDAGIEVSVLPGPSAVLAALVVSGLAVDRFCFEGFCPRKAGERRRRFAELADEERTMVFFEAPHRLSATLEDMASVFGSDRPAALCRELTKTHEEVRRGSLAELAAGAEGTRGEITLVVSGRPARQVSGGPDDWVAAVRVREGSGEERRAAIAAVAAAHRVPRRDVYDAVVRSRD